MKEKYIEYKRALQLQGGDINDNLIDEEEAQQSNRKSTQSKHTRIHFSRPFCLLKVCVCLF